MKFIEKKTQRFHLRLCGLMTNVLTSTSGTFLDTNSFVPNKNFIAISETQLPVIIVNCF